MEDNQENIKIFKCKFCGKEFTNTHKLGGHTVHCNENPNKLKVCNFNAKNGKNMIRKMDERIECYCQYCNKEYFSINSLRQHEIRCKQNPNKIYVISNFIKYNNDTNKVVWNKGLTAATSESVKQQTITIKKRYKEGKIIPSQLGVHKTEEEKQQLRILALNYLKNCISGYQARYNKNSIKYIDDLNKQKCWNLQHAENGGEFEILGYFVDGYDKNLNIVFEYDEPRHYKNVYENILHDKDIQRQNNIINELHCEFWRYNEKLDLLYKVN